MPILTDPIVSALLAEFQLAASQLEESRSNSAVSTAARLDVVKQLCELSRDVRFHPGPPMYADADQLDEVATAFEAAVETIRSLWVDSQAPGEIDDYCDNIMEHANRCRV